MRNETRALVNAYVSHVARLNGVTESDVRNDFTVVPTIQQKLWDKVQESSAFLQLINMIMVAEMSGSLVGMGINSTIAGRTDTAANDRLGSDPTDLDERVYNLQFTEFDVAILWAKLDQWAKFPDFQVRWAALIARRIALDLIMVGWNGVSIAKPTNRATYPLLQDVNKGWLQKMREQNAARVMTDGATPGHIYYGTGGDYLNLDALVYDAKNTLLPTWAKDDTGLVAICNSNLLHDKYFPLVNKDQDAQNTLATDVILSTKRLGGLQAMAVPYFPDGKIFITRPDNLSIYAQEGKHRRHILDNPKRARLEDYQSDNLDYVIEDLEYGCLIENIEPAA
jgi:P2 family phage major capsid protein